MYCGDGRKVEALLNNMLTYCDSNDARQCSQDHMATFLEGFKGIFGFDLLGRAPGADEESDDADGLTALGSSQRSVTVSTAGVCCKKQYMYNRFVAVSEVFDAGQGASNVTDASEGNHTDSSSDSGDHSTVLTPRRSLKFKVFKNQDATNIEEYLSSVLNWKAEPFVSGRALCTAVKFGPYTLAELESSVKDAADAAGFFAYSHKGARKTSTSCSLKFGCDCARKRYGSEKAAIEQKDREFKKDMDEVVRDTSGKRKKTEKRRRLLESTHRTIAC